MRKPSPTRILSVVFLGVACAAALLLFISWRSRPADVGNREASEPADHRDPLVVSPPPPPRKIEGQLPTISEHRASAARKPEKLHKELETLLANNPDIEEFRRLHLKVLPRREDREALHQMYEDTELIETSRQDLLDPRETTFSKDAELKRMYRTLYLGSALEWQENPHYSELVKAVEDVIFANNLITSKPNDLRRSLAGDKMELYMAMLHFAPERAESIAQQVRGMQVEPLLVYAKHHYDEAWAGANEYQSQPHE